MPNTLPVPEVVCRYFDDSFEPPLPAMALRWDPDAARAERVWDLPEDVRIAGPPPRHFGIAVRRRGLDTYAVRLLWDHTALRWHALTRAQLLTSALLPLLKALGTDLWFVLDSQGGGGHSEPGRAA